MKNIILILSIVLFSCNRTTTNQVPSEKDTTVIRELETFKKIKTNDIEIINFIKSKYTPTGISLIILPDGKKFLYSEGSNGVGICQIFDSYNSSKFIDSISEPNEPMY